MKKIIAQRFNYEIIKTMSLDKLVNYKDHDRMRVFYQKGCTCVNCGIVGKQLAIGVDRGGGQHIDVYTDDFYPLTVDHIIPRSKGGSNHIDNLQPMCSGCNSEKGNGDDINLPKPKLKEEEYTQKDFKIGDTVYRIGKKQRAVLLGEIEELYLSSISKTKMCKLSNRHEYNIKFIYKKIC